MTFCALLFLVFLTLELDGNEDFPARTILAPLIALYAMILVFLPVLLLITRHYVRVSSTIVIMVIVIMHMAEETIQRTNSRLLRCYFGGLLQSREVILCLPCSLAALQRCSLAALQPHWLPGSREIILSLSCNVVGPTEEDSACHFTAHVRQGSRICTDGGQTPPAG